MPVTREFATPYGTVMIVAVRVGRVYFDAFSSGLSLTIDGAAYAVSLSLDQLPDGTWVISDDGRDIKNERLRFVCRPAASRDDPATELPGPSPIRTGVINQIVPRVITWADNLAHQRDFLVAERDALVRELKALQNDINRAHELVDQAEARKLTVAAKLATIREALGERR